jgi:hypothetical protein
MRKILFVAALAATAALAACGHHDQPVAVAQPAPQVAAQPAPQVIEQPAPQPQTVYVQAPPQQPQVIVERHDDGVANAIVTAAAINAMTQPRTVHVYHPPVVVHQPVYVAPRPVYVAPRPVYIAPRPVYRAPVRASAATSSGYRSR